MLDASIVAAMVQRGYATDLPAAASACPRSQGAGSAVFTGDLAFPGFRAFAVRPWRNQRSPSHGFFIVRSANGCLQPEKCYAIGTDDYLVAGGERYGRIAAGENASTSYC
jgi:hypothetical protein